MQVKDLKDGDRFLFVYRAGTPDEYTGHPHCVGLTSYQKGDVMFDPRSCNPNYPVRLLPNDLPVTSGAADRASLGENPKQRYGDLKAPLQLVPPALEIEASWGLEEGGEKYGPYNWRESKVKMMTYLGAIKRHVNQMIDGENIDPEAKNGKTHLAGLCANAAILADAIAGGFVIDDRPKPGPASKMLAQFAANKKKRMGL